MTKLYEYVTSQRSLAIATISLFLYVFIGGVYRLYFSPIAKFPGPKLSALTFWFEFYYDVICPGKFYEKIGKWHEQYGPIIRINPYELHIHDIDFYETMYNHPLQKWPRQVRRFGVHESTFTAIHPEVHRTRRAAIAPFFSKKSVLGLTHVIHETIEKLCARIEKCRREKNPVPMTLAYDALTTDIINEYAIAVSTNFMDQPDFALNWHDMMFKLYKGGSLMQMSPWIADIMESLPEKVVAWMNPEMSMIFKYRDNARNRVKMVMDGTTDSANKTHRTIFADLLESNIPESAKSIDNMTGEAQIVLGAGSVTTAHTLATMTYHMLANPDILARARKEITDVMPQSSHQPPDLHKLEALPYFTACIQESLRFSYGVAGRITRTSREPMKYGDWVIPAGAPINMSIPMMHRDENAFQDPMSFKPDRWLVKEDREQLDRYFCSFGKGPRSCLGMYLAWTELYLTMATLLHRFDMHLFETDRRDVEFECEYAVPYPKPGSKGVRVVVQ